jgi:hypothetical protein
MILIDTSSYDGQPLFGASQRRLPWILTRDVLRDDRDRQINLQIVIVLREYEIEIITLLPNEAKE